MGLWQLRKLSHATAKSEMLQARGRVAVLLKEISTVESMEENFKLKAKRNVWMKALWDI